MKTDCKWSLIRFALSVLDVRTLLVWRSRSGPIPCESWREFFKKENNFLGANLERSVSPAGEMFWSGLLTPSKSSK